MFSIKNVCFIYRTLHLYIMFKAWDSFRGWKILKYLLGHSRKMHVRGIARELKISPSIVQHYLLEYYSEGLLEKEKSANSVNYKLKESPLTMELKRAYFISHLSVFAKEFTEDNPAISTISLYGSHAKGTYDEKSDVDIIVISQKKDLSLKAVERLELLLGKEVNIQIYTIAEWDNLLIKGNNFAQAVLRNNILLYGAEL